MLLVGVQNMPRQSSSSVLLRDNARPRLFEFSHRLDHGLRHSAAVSEDDLVVILADRLLARVRVKGAFLGLDELIERQRRALCSRLGQLLERDRNSLEEWGYLLTQGLLQR